MTPKLLTAILICCLFCSCVANRYYLSPYLANNQPYRAMPLVSDSIKSTFYASGGFVIGRANENLRDENLNFHASVHRAHVFNNIQLNYGVNALAGNYKIRPTHIYYDYAGAQVDPNRDAGNRFYGGFGGFAGINFVIPFKRTGSEWRVIGIETNFQKELGDYYNFRKGLADSMATAIWRPAYFHTIGITTNAIRRGRRPGNAFGYKAGLYFSTYQTRQLPNVYGTSILPVYVSNTIHLTKRNVTGYVQINIGNYASNFQTGVNVKLGNK